MFTLGFLCLFMAFVLAIMFMMALATRDRAGEQEGEAENRESGDGK